MARLNLSFLNTFAVALEGEPITQFRSAKNQGLLAYLALNGDQPHPRDVLATLFWPEETEKNARHNLRQALYHLRNILGDTKRSGEPFLSVTRGTAGFNRQSDYQLDVDQFVAAIEGNELATAAALYQGELLPGFTCDGLEFEDWLRQERENLHQQALTVMSELTQQHLTAGRLEQAQEMTRRQLKLEPWRESAFRQLMQAYALAGDRANALVTYERCREVLWEELGVEPAAETVALVEDIKAGRLDALRPAEKPASSEGLPHNLPAQVTPFIGRRQELTEIQRLLLETDCRLLTVVGFGGMGKTRTAIEAARAIAGSGAALFPDGVRFATFAPADDRESALRALADALEYQSTGGGVPQDKQLLTVLSLKQLLLLVDNLEHLLGSGMGKLLDDILRVAPGIKLLVTSRERINLRAETVLMLSGLDEDLPALIEGETFDEGQVPDAIRLIVQSARQAMPDFELSEENTGAIAVICRLCEGMPLAIELAAGWLGVLTPAEIAAELAGSLDILSTTMRDVPERQRSLRAVFEGSWQRLSAQEQKAFLRLSVFRGGFQRPQGEAATGISLPVLLSLVNKSFLQREAGGRFGLHEQLRFFANELLKQDNEAWQAAKEAHSQAYATFMAEQLPRLRGKAQWTALQRIERELDNIRVAWEWLLAEGKLEVILQELLPGLHRFAYMRMRQADVQPLVQVALDKVKPLGRALPSSAYLILQTATIDLFVQQVVHPPFIYPAGKELLQVLWPHVIAHQREMGGWFDYFLRHHIFNVGEDEAWHQWESYIANLRGQGDGWRLAHSLKFYAITLLITGRDYIHPSAYLDEALQLFRQQGDEFEFAVALFFSAVVADWAGDRERAFAGVQQAQLLLAGKGAAVHRGRMVHEVYMQFMHMGRSREGFVFLVEEQDIYRRINRLDRLKESLHWESIMAGRYSDLDHAFWAREESMELGRTIARSQGQDKERFLAWDYFELGELYRVAGDVTQARDYYEKAEALFRSQTDVKGNAYYRRAMGDLALAERNFDAAAAHFRFYLAQRDALFFIAVGIALVGLGRALRGLGRHQESEERLQEALAEVDNPAVIDFVIWPIIALAELRAAQKNYTESALLAAYVLRHQLAWLEMRHLATAIWEETHHYLDPVVDIDNAAQLADQTLIPNLHLTHLPSLQ